MGMKKLCAVFLAVLMLCSLFSGCAEKNGTSESAAVSGGGKAEEGDASASDEEESEDAGTDYEYVFRKIGEQKYVEPAESFAGGSGTESDPYQISNAAELALLSEVYEIYGQTQDRDDERVKPYYEAYFVLTDDIVINEREDNADWSQTPPEYAWTPIGFHREFRGVFDGAGHTVSGLYINADVTEKGASSDNSFGLFGENEGTIKNLNLKNSYICVGGYSSNVGGIAGRNLLEDHSVENCTVSADLYVYDAICGGVVGSGRGTVKDCVFSGSVTCLREDGNGSQIGGVVGSCYGAVVGCKNSGTVYSAVTKAGYTGGIAGSGTSVSDCENSGTVTGGLYAGGIVGLCRLTGGGGDLELTRADIVNCKNSGEVTTDGETSGGVVGSVGIDYSDYTATISGCENTGSIRSRKTIGGLIGEILLRGEGGVSVSACTNSADLEGEDVGGIVGSASAIFGTLTMTDCKNSGTITGTQYGAGISAVNNLMTWDEDKAYPLNITVSGCENTGVVTTAQGGGIAGVFLNTIPAEYGSRVSLLLENDVNSADIQCTDSNAFLGGIAGNVGVPNGAVTVKDCLTSGVIAYPEVAVDEETTGTSEGQRMELSRIGGGIVGMVDSGLWLSTGNDGENAAQVNSPDAKIVFTGCHSDMTFRAPDENAYVYDDDGAPVYLNRFGGVLGFCSDDEGLAFRVEDCTYTGCDRGLGNSELADVGTKQ